MARKQGLQLRPKLISIAVASCFVTTTALANPTGPTVVHGVANIQQVGNLLKITNSPSAIINWQSFSIGASEITRFIQQSQSSAVLNRVTGSAGVIDPSVILGALQSNGRVFLINPSGILFGAGAQIDVAGLVASSLNLSNADFLANRLKFTDVPGAGSVINQGNITTGSGGNVYLVGSAVTNNGIITSPQGEVVLAAGNSVELVNPGTPNLRVEVSAQDEEARNLGQIIVDAGRVGIYAGLINNSGTINASSAVAEGGKILLKAKREVTLESTSILDASGAGGGKIEVLAKDGGTVNVNGRLDASAPVSGDGGFIDTSADVVKVADGSVVRTGASNGKSGTWLIDPNDYTIDALAYGGDISGATLSSNLDDPYGGNIVLTTDMGASYGGGNMYVKEAVSWGSANSLTLIARNDVNVDAPVTNAGTGSISMYAGWDGFDNEFPTVNPGTGSILVDQNVTTLGSINLIAGSGLSLGTGAQVVAGQDVLLQGGDLMSLAGTGNKVQGANINIRSFGFLNIDTASTGGGVSLTQADLDVLRLADPSIGMLTLESSGDIAINESAVFGAGPVNNIQTVVLKAPGSIYQKNLADDEVNAALTVKNLGIDGGEGEVSMYAANMIDRLAIHRQNGFGTESVSFRNAKSLEIGAVGDVSGVDVVASNGGAIVDILVTGGTLTVNEPVLATSNNGGEANIHLQSSGMLTVNSTVAATAGDDSPGRNANVVLVSTAGGITVNNGSVSAIGGDSTDGGDGGNAYVTLCTGTYSDGCDAGASTGGILVSNSFVGARGGDGDDWGGEAVVRLDAGTGGVSVQNSSGLDGFSGAGIVAWGGSGSSSGGRGQVSVVSRGGITVNNSLIDVRGGSAESFWQRGNAHVELIAPGAINITGDGNNDTIVAEGREARVNIAGFEGNPAASISLTNARVRAIADGAEGQILAYANGLINLTGSSLQAESNNDEAVVSIQGGSIAVNGTFTESPAISAVGGYSDEANVVLVSSAANGTVSVTNARIEAIRRAGEGSDDAEVLIAAEGSGGSVVLNGAEVVAAGAEEDRGSGVVGISAVGNITLTSSRIEASALDDFFNSDVAAIGLEAGGNIVSTNSSIIALGDSASTKAIVGLIAGGNISLTGYNPVEQDQSAVRAVGGEGSPTLVGMLAGGNITIGARANVTSSGAYGGTGWFAPYVSNDVLALFPDGGSSDFTGVAMQGNRIISNGGLTAGVLHASTDQAIALRAVNGIGVAGAAPAPVRIQDGSDATGPELFFLNTSSTAGDIAVSFVDGPVAITDDIVGTRNNNVNGTYFIGVENGNFDLSAPFLPGQVAPAALLPGQKVVVHALNGDVNVNAYGSIITAGAGSTTLIGTNVYQNSGSSLPGLLHATATTGEVSLTQAGSYSLGNLKAAGNISVISTGGAINDGSATGANIWSPTAYLEAATGIGSGNALETKVGTIGLSSGGNIGIINDGDLILDGLSFNGTTAAIYASTQFGAGSGSLSLAGPVAVTGNLSLLSDTGMALNTDISATGALVLDAGGGNLDIEPGLSGTLINAGTVVMRGADVNLGHASQTSSLDIVGNSGLGIIAGNLNVQGGNGGYTFVRSTSGNLAISTTGNVNVTGGTSGGFAHVLGFPDVVMSVGGTVNIDATDPSAPARIESGLPTTIHLDFTNLTSGGYFVNGVEFVVADPELGTGFYADGSPAVLGQNLIVTYGGVPPQVGLPGIEQAIAQVIASTNENSVINEDDKDPETNNETNVIADGKEKKELPVCK